MTLNTVSSIVKVTYSLIGTPNTPFTVGHYNYEIPQ
jgi:hypothetical protein